MPAIYQSFEIEPGMTIEQKQAKLYLAMISAGEQAYTLGAAIAELRKKSEAFDEFITKLRNDFQTLKREVKDSMQLTDTPEFLSDKNEWVKVFDALDIPKHVG